MLNVVPSANTSTGPGAYNFILSSHAGGTKNFILNGGNVGLTASGLNNIVAPKIAEASL